MPWGLVPSWWSKLVKELKLATFNARAETAAEKPFFREGFKLLSKDKARRIAVNIAELPELLRKP
jgi:SOS response associated peptidase (SRAP)